MSEFIQDLRFAVRTLRRGWGVTLIALGSLAVAIGGNTAVFGMINALLFPPLPGTEPERIIMIQERPVEQPATLSTLTTSLATHADLAERSRTTTDWAAYRPTVRGLRADDRSEPVTAAEITSNFFEVIGSSMARGRAFLAEEGVPGARPVAIVTPEFWERARGGEGDPLGAVLTLNGEPVEVVGVLPPSFAFLFGAADVWVPLTDAPSESPRDRRDIFSLARLAPGVTMEQAQADVTRIAAALAAEYPEVQRDWTADAFNVRTDIPDGRSKIFYALLQGSVFFVLLIACANITNLLLARAQERQREIGLRTVLGAGRRRIVRQLLTESGLLVLLGSTAGLALGWVGIRAMARYFGTFLPANYTPQMDATVVGFTVGLSVLAGLIFGVAPAVQALRVDQAGVMKEGGRGSTRGRSRKVVTRGLVVAEIALSLVALGGGSVLVRAFLDLQASDGGFDESSIVTARLTVPRSKYPDADTRGVLMEQVIDEARSIEGVRAAALVNALPRGLSAPTDTFRIAGRERDAAAAAPRAVSLKASPDYLDVLGVALLQGRFFEPGDRAGQDPVAVVNRAFADRWFERDDPVGRFVHFEGEDRRIVGVVEDVQQVLIRTPGVVDAEAIYIPAAQAPMSDYTVVASAANDPLRLKEPLRLGLQSLDPDLTLTQVLTLEELVEQFFAGVNVFNVILGGFGLIGILLASLGTYGVLAYQVTQRRQEIGIRMAVGASGRDVLRMVTRQGLWMAAIGLALGGVLLVPLIRLFATLLEGFASVKGETGFAVAALLFAVTVAASVLPARRAAAMDPVRALGNE